MVKRDGRATGEAYVVCGDQQQAGDAIKQLNKKYMGTRYIELFEVAESDLAAVKCVLEDTSVQGFVVRLRGLPYTATVDDIKRFLEGAKLADDTDAIVFVLSADGRPNGEAYVELQDGEALTAALAKHKALIGTRYIEVFHSSRIDKLQAMQQRFVRPAAVYSRWAAHMWVSPTSAGATQTQPALVSSDTQPHTADDLASNLQDMQLYDQRALPANAAQGPAPAAGPSTCQLQAGQVPRGAVRSTYGPGFVTAARGVSLSGPVAPANYPGVAASTPTALEHLIAPYAAAAGGIGGYELPQSPTVGRMMRSVGGQHPLYYTQAPYPMPPQMGGYHPQHGPVDPYMLPLSTACAPIASMHPTYGGGGQPFATSGCSGMVAIPQQGPTYQQTSAGTGSRAVALAALGASIGSGDLTGLGRGFIP
eukprot:GHRR01013473.1.p1 GENE.GHRR01013473.1~~GHRR01013473.1.p1  ORF type:complete len:421 (+),score=127.43 GHRR01013473.1:354-1616(+)